MISLSEPYTSLSNHCQAFTTAEFLSEKVMDFIGIRSILLLIRCCFIKMGVVKGVKVYKILVNSSCIYNFLLASLGLLS